MLFVKEPTEEKEEQENAERKNRTYPHGLHTGILHTAYCIRYALASTGRMPAITAHLKQSFPVPLILTTSPRVCIQLGSGTNALALNGSRCHNDSCKVTKLENTILFLHLKHNFPILIF